MTRGVRDVAMAARSELIVARVLRRARRKGWDDAKTAAVILASLRPARVKAGVVGPCFYCGDDLAGTVDHLMPVSRGGTDARANLVSSCWACNDLKSVDPLLFFLWVHPFGSDRVRERAYHDGLKADGLERLRPDYLNELMSRWYPRAYELPREVAA